MKEGFKKSYYKKTPGFPSKGRIKKGPVVVIECPQEIPCNPCELSCPFGAIKVGEPITNLPVLKEDKCKACGKCLTICPGMAIFLLNWTYNNKEASLTIPYEFLPFPYEGEKVDCTNRLGEKLCEGRVIKVVSLEKNERTGLVTFAFPKEFYREVRNIRLKR